MDDRTRNIIWAFAGLCCLNLIASLDITALSVCIPTISTSLNATSTQAYWTGTAFILASAVFQPVISALSNAFGCRLMLQFSLLIFAAGTVVCATAGHITLLLVGRSLQGVGGGGMLTLTYVVMADMLSLRGRARGIAVLSVVWIVGSCTGPVMGGAFTSYVSWRWIFWVVLPLVGIALILVTFFLHTPFQPEKTSRVLRKMDWGGATLFVASLTSFLVAISWGGTQFQWQSYATLVPLILGVLGLCSWLLYEKFVTKNAMLPLAVLSNRTALIGFIDTTLMGIVQFCLLYFLPLYYEASKGYTPLISGVALLPFCIGSCLGALTGSQYITRTGHYNIATYTGWALMAAGSGILVLLESTTSIPAWIFMNVVPGMGIGCLFASLSIATQAPQEEKYMATAAGLTPFFRAIGQAFGIVIGDAVYQNQLKKHLLHSSSVDLKIHAGELAKESAGITVVLQLLPKSGEEYEMLLEAFNRSLHVIWWVCVGISVLGLGLSVFMREYCLDRGVEGSEGTGTEDIETRGKTDSAGGAARRTNGVGHGVNGDRMA